MKPTPSGGRLHEVKNERGSLVLEWNAKGGLRNYTVTGDPFSPHADGGKIYEHESDHGRVRIHLDAKGNLQSREFEAWTKETRPAAGCNGCVGKT